MALGGPNCAHVPFPCVCTYEYRVKQRLHELPLSTLRECAVWTRPLHLSAWGYDSPMPYASLPAACLPACLPAYLHATLPWLCGCAGFALNGLMELSLAQYLVDVPAPVGAFVVDCLRDMTAGECAEPGR
jgi:hypothetical protein